MTHIWVSELITIIGSDNGLLPGRCQAIIWTNAGILLIGTLGTNFSEILSKIHTFSFKKMHLKMSSGRWGPFCLGLNELITFLPHRVQWQMVDEKVIHSQYHRGRIILDFTFFVSHWICPTENTIITETVTYKLMCLYTSLVLYYGQGCETKTNIGLVSLLIN